MTEEDPGQGGSRSGTAAPPTGRRPERPGGGSSRADRGVPPAPAALSRRHHHAGPRRRGQGVGRADRRRVPRGVQRARALEPLNDAAVIDAAVAASGSRSRPTRSSSSRSAFPAGRSAHLAVNGTVNDLAVMGARPAWLSAAFVLEEGFAVSELRKIVADMAEAAGAAGVAIVTGDTKVVDRGAADGLYMTTAGVGRHPGRAPRSAPTSSQRGDRILISGTIGRPRHGGHAGARRPGARGRHQLRHRAGRPSWSRRCSRPLRRPAGCATRPAAGSAPSATSWLATPASPSCSTRPRCRSTQPSRGVRPARHRPALRRQRGQVRWRSSPPTRPMRRSAALRAHPLGAERGDDRRHPGRAGRASSCCGRLRGTRIVDMLVGDPLPRIC